MQYNSETNSQDIVSCADDLAGTNSTSYPLAAKTRAANQGLRLIWSWIFDAYGGWHYDDRNQTNLPEATTTLTTGQSFYSLPTDSAHVLGLSVKTTGSTWTKLDPITLEQIQQLPDSEANFLTTNGPPRYYRPLANGFKIYPASNYTQAASLELFFSRDVSTFAPSDTIKTPGFDSEFHEAVVVYIALQYAKRKLLPVAAALYNDWQRYEQLIRKHYSKRYQEMFPPRIAAGNDIMSEFT